MPERERSPRNPKGAGRPKGSRSTVQQQAIDVAHAVLASIDQAKLWKRFLNSSDDKIALEAFKYLTDRAHGKPTQRTDISGTIGLADVLAKANEMTGDE